MLSAWRTLASAPLLRRPFTSTRPLLKLAAPPPPPDDKLPTGCMVGVVVSNKMQNSCVVRVERLAPRGNARAGRLRLRGRDRALVVPRREVARARVPRGAHLERLLLRDGAQLLRALVVLEPVALERVGRRLPQVADDGHRDGWGNELARHTN